MRGVLQSSPAPLRGGIEGGGALRSRPHPTPCFFACSEKADLPIKGREKSGARGEFSA
ncbi:hypothetical protein GCM10007913_20930 [Devosia yakushimensis]|uniref:Uncharacterized protein n=1 Tax=Devosia yakushimensis TaxID=470028 RepID=A0ABQ5UFA5_9HYPH|nr:hypothetical protein GCM10007913_20930 [Devosia yakushimensis]